MGGEEKEEAEERKRKKGEAKKESATRISLKKRAFKQRRAGVDRSRADGIVLITGCSLRLSSDSRKAA